MVTQIPHKNRTVPETVELMNIRTTLDGGRGQIEPCPRKASIPRASLSSIVAIFPYKPKSYLTQPELLSPWIMCHYEALKFSRETTTRLINLMKRQVTYRPFGTDRPCGLDHSPARTVHQNVFIHILSTEIRYARRILLFTSHP